MVRRFGCRMAAVLLAIALPLVVNPPSAAADGDPGGPPRCCV